MPINSIKRQLKSSILPFQRRFLSERARSVRKEDAKNDWHNHRSLRVIKKDFGVDLREVIKKRVKNNSKISVLDIGSGKNVSLIELSKIFGSRVDLHGLTVTQKRESILTRYFGVNKVASSRVKKHVGLFEEYKFKQRFDFVYSFAGIHYTVAPQFVIEKLCNLLNQGGMAIIQFPSSRINSEMKRQMLKQGYQFRVIKEKGDFQTDIIIIKNIKGEELSFTNSTPFVRIPKIVREQEKKLLS